MIWSKECNESVVKLYALTGTVVDQFDAVFGGEGIARDPHDGTFWVLTEQQLHHVERIGSGANVLGSYPNPSHHYPPDILAGYTVSGAAEGLVIDPSDGTLWFNADQHFHGGVPDGNRCWHIDPLQSHDQFVRFPGGVRWERGVGVQTQVVGEELRLAGGAAWGEYVTAILDLGAQPTFADSLVSFGGGEVTRAYRGTNTAPTTMPLEHITRPYYDAHQENAGWGATVPGDWLPNIPATRFLQVRMTLHAHSAAAPTPYPLSDPCRVVPSPFRTKTYLTFALAQCADVSAHVFDVQGRRLRTLLHAHLAPGEHAIAWDGRDNRGRRVPAGTDVLRLVTDQQTIQGSVLAVGE
jgi:hypothetical protein